MEGRHIQDLKACAQLSYRGLNLGASIAPKLYNLSLKNALKFLILGVFFEPKFDFEHNKNANGNIFSRNFSGDDRPDFQEIYSFVVSSCDVDLWAFRRRINLLMAPVFVLDWMFLFPKNRTLNLSLLEAISVTSLECFYRKVIRLLEAFNWNDYKCYVSFCDSYLEENLAAQMAKREGLKTITLQHGQFKNTAPNIITDSEAYLNFVSDYMLVWGQATVDQMVSAAVPKSRLLLSGVPKYIYDKRHESPHSERGPLCIYLNGDNHFESNHGMIKVCVNYCENNGIDFYIRRHPSSIKELDSAIYGSSFFKGFISGNNKITPLNVVNSSGVSIDLIMRGSIVAMYVDENTNELYRKLGLHFHDLEGLTRQFECGLSHANLRAKSYLNYAYDEAHARSLYHRHITGAVSDVD